MAILNDLKKLVLNNDLKKNDIPNPYPTNSRQIFGQRASRNMKNLNVFISILISIFQFYSFITNILMLLTVTKDLFAEL